MDFWQQQSLENVLYTQTYIYNKLLCIIYKACMGEGSVA